MRASLRSFPGAVALNRNLSPSTMQSNICTSCRQVFSRRSGLTRHSRSTHVHLHRISCNHSALDELDYELADLFLQFDDDTQSQRPETEIYPNTEVQIDDTVRVQPIQDDDWDPLALFATLQQWQLCSSIVDTILGKTKLNNILKRRLIVPYANAKNPDQLY
jgi:hypothetical protein